jgi:hypothetical protein
MAILITNNLYNAMYNNNNTQFNPSIPVALNSKAKAYIMLSYKKGPSTQIQNYTIAKDYLRTLGSVFT